MTSVFDGMAGLLADVFGSSITVTPSGGSATAVTGIFREGPIKVPDADGFPVTVVSPTLRIAASEGVTLAFGDAVDPGNGRTYRVVDPVPSGSPAADAFTIYSLEEVVS